MNRPTHVYGVRHDDRITIAAKGVGRRYPVRYPDTDKSTGIAPKIGDTRRFVDGHAVAHTVPITGGRHKNPNKGITFPAVIPPGDLAKMRALADETNESVSAHFRAAVALYLSER